jgi:serine/threonine protein phosphatase PrpC
MAIESVAGAGLIRRTDFLFSFCREKMPGEGEDSLVYALNECRAMLGVFDGCGGSGAGRYPGLKGKTGAYLAARAACAAWMDWFEAMGPDAEPDPEALREKLTAYLRRCEENGGEDSGSKLLGSMSRKLPTTAAVALCSPARSGIDVLLQWAGDSRVYLLDGDGLAQLTQDDLGGLDAMQNLSADAPLTNAISLSRDFSIHSARLTMGRPGLLFAATDGCFGYFSTPMEFEHLLLSSLQSAPNIQAREKSLADAIGQTAGDDYTISGAAFNFGSFDNMKRQLARRCDLVYRTYIYGLESCSREEKQQLWEHYKPHYERLLCRP